MAIRLEKKQAGDFQLDMKGYGCPHIQVYTEKALKAMSVGDELTVIFDNPSSGESIAFMCELKGNRLEQRQAEAGVFTWKIRKETAAS